MVFDLDKFEAMHFIKKKNYSNPKIILPAYVAPDHAISQRVIKLLRKNMSMNWLRVYFDHKLSFLDHANKMANKGWKAVAGLTMLVKTTHKVNVIVMHKVVHAYILPILIYTTSAQWPGQNQTNTAGWTIYNKVNAQCDKLNKAQNIALCAIFPKQKTVPIHVLQWKAKTPPTYHTLNYLCKLTALQFHKLEAVTLYS